MSIFSLYKSDQKVVIKYLHKKNVKKILFIIKVLANEIKNLEKSKQIK